MIEEPWVREKVPCYLRETEGLGSRSSITGNSHVSKFVHRNELRGNLKSSFQSINRENIIATKVKEREDRSDRTIKVCSIDPRNKENICASRNAHQNGPNSDRNISVSCRSGYMALTTVFKSPKYLLVS